LTNINITPIVQFVIYSILNTPINVAWQGWLESNFPSTKPVIKTPKEKAEPAKQEEVLDLKNTILKFLLDQTVGAAFNIPLYFIILGTLKGQSVDHILTAVKRVSSIPVPPSIALLMAFKQDSLNIYFSGMKLWPPVSLISFVFVPAEQRVIFGSIAGVIWNIYLSLMAQ
jgi:hypothetical protein